MDEIQNRFLTSPSRAQRKHSNGDYGCQENNMVRDTELSNLAMAAAADRATVSNLTATISQLTAELAATSAQLVAALANNTTLKASIRRGRGGGRGRGRGGGRGGDITDLLFRAWVGGPIGRY